MRCSSSSSYYGGSSSSSASSSSSSKSSHSNSKASKRAIPSSIMMMELDPCVVGKGELRSTTIATQDNCNDMDMSFSFDQLVTPPSSSTNRSRSLPNEGDLSSDSGSNGSQEEVQQYREFSEVASSLLGAPMARVSASTGTGQPRRSRRHVVLASHGFEASQSKQLPASSSFEAHLSPEDDMLVVYDALLDARFRNLPEVRGADAVRFCVVVPIVNPHDPSTRLGAVCVMDTRPRPHGLCEEEITTLREVAAEVADLMERRRHLRALEERSWASAPTNSSAGVLASTTTSRPTNVPNFLRLLELLAESFAKRVSVYLSVLGPVPETLMFSEAEAFGSAVAVLKSACDQTTTGYIHLRLSLQPSADGSSGDCLVFECESTTSTNAAHSDDYDKHLTCLPVVANYMNSVGGQCGAQQPTRSAAAHHQRRGSVVWFSLPVVVAAY